MIMCLQYISRSQEVFLMGSNVTCKLCGANHCHLVFDFGNMPAVNSFITEAEASIEKSFPLVL